MSEQESLALKLKRNATAVPAIAQILGVRRESAYRILRRAEAKLLTAQKLAAEFG